MISFNQNVSFTAPGPNLSPDTQHEPEQDANAAGIAPGQAGQWIRFTFRAIAPHFRVSVQGLIALITARNSDASDGGLNCSVLGQKWDRVVAARVDKSKSENA